MFKRNLILCIPLFLTGCLKISPTVSNQSFISDYFSDMPFDRNETFSVYQFNSKTNRIDDPQGKISFTKLDGKYILKYYDGKDKNNIRYITKFKKLSDETNNQRHYLTQIQVEDSYLYGIFFETYKKGDTPEYKYIFFTKKLENDCSNVPDNLFTKFSSIKDPKDSKKFQCEPQNMQALIDFLFDQGAESMQNPLNAARLGNVIGMTRD